MASDGGVIGLAGECGQKSPARFLGATDFNEEPTELEAIAPAMGRQSGCPLQVTDGLPAVA
jgi:hypothetical protein